MVGHGSVWDVCVFILCLETLLNSLVLKSWSDPIRLFIYLLFWKAEWERERESGRNRVREPPPTGSLSKWLQQQGLRQACARSWKSLGVSYVGGWNPMTLASQGHEWEAGLEARSSNMGWESLRKLLNPLCHSACLNALWFTIMQSGDQGSFVSFYYDTDQNF